MSPATRPAPLSFPPLFDVDVERWVWPLPPFKWRHVRPPAVDVAQPCRVETADGGVLEGGLEAFEPAQGRLVLRVADGGTARVDLPLERCRRMTLAAPLVAMSAGQAQRQSLLGAVRPIEFSDHGSASRLPLAAHERAYTLAPPADGGATLSGLTVGWVETPHGLFLFEPTDDDMALHRRFAPRAANGDATLGPTVLELAMRQWATTPEQLLAAIDRQRSQPVPRLGDAAMAMGLLTPAQLSRALRETDNDHPLGLALVDEGLLTRPQLQAVIAHKMGTAIADLTRFDPDPALLARLPRRVAHAHRLLPLFVHDDRVYVASDRVPADDALRAMRGCIDLPAVHVLASATHLTDALRGLPEAAFVR